MALSNKEHQQNYYQRRKQEQKNGLERKTFILPLEVMNRINSLAVFFEVKPEEVIARSVSFMWEERYAIPQEIKKPKTVKVEGDPPEKKGRKKKEPSKRTQVDEPSPFATILPSVHLSNEDYAAALSRKKPTVIEGKAERIIEPPKSDSAKPDGVEDIAPFPET